MTDTQIWGYIVANWPSIATGAIIAVALYRLKSYEERVTRLEKRLARQISVCIDDEPARAKELLSDD